MSWFGSMFECFGCLFQMTFPDDCFGLLFQMTISDTCFRWLFRITVPDDYIGSLYQMTFPDGSFGLLFQMNISDSYFSNQFVFPRSSIPISTNHSADWSHDWFVFERRLPTADFEDADRFLVHLTSIVIYLKS